MSVNFGDGETLIPTVSDEGTVMGDDEAVEYYKKTKRHLGKFKTPKQATDYANRLHSDQEKLYSGKR